MACNNSTQHNGLVFYIAMPLLIMSAAQGILGCRPEPSVAASLKPGPKLDEARVKNTPLTDNPPQSQYATVRRGKLRHTVPVIGSLYPRRITKIGPQISSRVQEILVDVGDVVAAGQKLVTLDPSFFQIEVAQRQAEMAVVQSRIVTLEQKIKTQENEITLAKIALEDAELQLSRMKKLWQKPPGATPSVPQKMYDDALFRQRQSQVAADSAILRLGELQANLAETRAMLKQSKQAVKYAEQRLEEATIRAPYAAVVTKKMVDPGEPATSAPVIHLLEIQDVKTLYLEFSLPQTMLGMVSAKSRVEFEIEGIDGSQGHGEISMIFPVVEEANRAFRCRVVVENSKLLLKPGLLVQVQVVIQEVPQALIVPRRSLGLNKEGGSQVYVVKEEGGRNVQLGLITENEVEIVAGLAEGERVFLGE